MKNDTGLQTAIAIANNAITQSCAYKNFLKFNNFKEKTINSNNFFNLPISNKKSYVKKYNILKYFPNKQIPETISASSGSSGKPTFWFRSETQENIGAEIHEFIFNKIFNISKKTRTLVIVCFSMGVWVAGNFTTESCKKLKRIGYNISVISPGIEINDITNILDNLAINFETTILIGYPPFIQNILQNYDQKKLKKIKNIKILTSGEKFSEEWRDAALKKINSKKLSDCISLYGCADAGILGFETPATIYFRRQLNKSEELKKVFINQNLNEIPLIAQYLPKYIFFESLNDELILTSNTSLPLIRYNLKDLGKIIYPENLKLNNLKQDIIQNFKNWPFPVIIKYGRSDVALTFYAINIYPEHLNYAIKKLYLNNSFTGNFAAFSKNINKQQTLEIFFETKNTQTPKKHLAEKFATHLSKVSTEYRKLWSSISTQALPKINLVNNLKKLPKTQGLIWIKNKKPKMLY